MKKRAIQAELQASGEDMIEVSFASEAPYQGEILRMSGMDASRISDGGPVLWNHDRNQLVGVASGVTVSGGKARAKIKLLDTPEALRIRSALAAGWRGDASVGYDYDPADTRAINRDTFEVLRWRALEISLVTVPADESVGLGRALQTEEQAQPVDTVEIIMEPVIDKPQPATLPELESIGNRSLNSAIPPEVRFRAIKELYQKEASEREANLRFLELAERHQQDAITKASTPQPLPCAERDIGKYSLSRAALLSMRGKLDGIEGEIHTELAGRCRNYAPQGICVPRELVSGQRTNLATANVVGGYLTSVDNRTDLLVPYLYPEAIASRLGCTQLTGLTNSFVLQIGRAHV